jgi:hypothetical protein
MAEKYYVTMTDKFMSGWGSAQGKINKLVLTCDSYTEANIVKQNAENRSDMKYINICTKKPCYNQDHYLVSWHDKNDYSTWYKSNHTW